MKKKLSILTLLFLLTAQCFSKEAALEDFYESYKSGNYPKALKILGYVSQKSLKEKEWWYFKGLCQSRMQNFDEALKSLRKVIELNGKQEDLYYEFGQAAYASNDFKLATWGFKKSIKKNYKKFYSHYYLGAIAEFKENFKKVKKNYLLIIKNPKSKPILKQTSYLRLADIFVEKVGKKREAKRLVLKYILPLLEKGIKVDPSSDLGKTMTAKKDELLYKHRLHPLQLISGRTINTIGWINYIKYGYTQDSNVTTASESNESSATLYSSGSQKLETQLSYRGVIDRKMILTPKFSFSKTSYTDQENGEVFTNDGHTLTTSFSFEKDHLMGKSSGTFSYELEYSYLAQDIYENHETHKYGIYTNHTIGEVFNIFKYGETTVKFKYKDFSSHEEGLSSKTKNFYLDQLFKINSIRYLITSLSIDYTAVDNTTYSSDTYALRVDYLMSQAFWQTNWILSLSSSFINTEEQKEERGLEKLLAFSVIGSKKINSFLSLEGTMSFNKKSSDDEAYQYSQNLFGISLKADF